VRRGGWKLKKKERHTEKSEEKENQRERYGNTEKEKGKKEILGDKVEKTDAVTALFKIF